MAQEFTEGGAATLAWRVLATLEGGTFAIAVTTLVVHTLRLRLKKKRDFLVAKKVLLSDKSAIGHDIERKLTSQGCSVSGLKSENASKDTLADALIIIGTGNKSSDLDTLSEMVSRDISENLVTLNSYAWRVRQGGYLVWVSVSDATAKTRGPFNEAIRAFDDVIKANLELVAKSNKCQAIWIDESSRASSLADNIVAVLINNRTLHEKRFNVRNTAARFGESLWRWLKIVVENK